MSSQIFGSGTLVISAIVAIGLIATKMRPLHPPYHSIVPYKNVYLCVKSNEKDKYLSTIITEVVVIVLK